MKPKEEFEKIIPMRKSTFDRLLKEAREEERQKILDEAKKIIQNWKDTSIKDEKIALMITNGGYIHKPTLLKILEELEK